MADGLPLALELVRRRGTVVLKTTIAGEQTLSVARVVVGSRCGPFDQALHALARGLVHVQPLISERFDLSDGVVAMARAAAHPNVRKVLLQIGAAGG